MSEQANPDMPQHSRHHGASMVDMQIRQALAQAASSGLLIQARRDQNEELVMKKKKQVAKRMPAKTPMAVVKDIFINDKVRVVEVTFKAGAEIGGMDLPMRVTRALRGGTLTRTFPNGKKEKVRFKTGEVKFGEAVPSHVMKNQGQGTIVLYSVFLK